MNNKWTKYIPYAVIIVFSVILFIVGIDYLKHRDDNNVPEPITHDITFKIPEDDSEWVKSVELSVLVDNENALGYTFSFDGGNTYQDSNKYTVTENGIVKVIVKDKDNNEFVSSYEIKNIDTEGPKVVFNFPNPINVGDEITLKDFVNVTDSISGVNSFSFNVETLDTSKEGEIPVIFTAVDNAHNETTIELNISVTKKNNEEEKEKKEENKKEENKKEESKKEENNTTNKNDQKKVTYYRYRNKIVSNYECNPYDCSYLNNQDKTTPSEVAVENKNANCSYSTSKISEYLDISKVPEKYMNTSGGYSLNSLYKIVKSGGKTIDYTYARADNYIIESEKQYTYKVNECDKDCSNRYVVNYVTNCGEGYYKYNGYCHKICATLQKKCPTNYELKDNSCYLKVKKTCYKTCEKVTWSEWSAWSTTKVISNDTTEVETKVE